MRIVVCPMCGRVLEIETFSNEFQTPAVRKKLKALLTAKCNKTVLSIEDIEALAIKERKLNGSNITNERVGAIREAGLCDKCVEIVVKHYDIVEKKEKADGKIKKGKGKN